MISIITITFNNYEDLIKTINSIPVSNQVESVVINGGSCERTKKFLESYKGKSLTEKDEGIADAFNKGVKLASGDYVMFLNSGDILIDSDYPENAIRIMDKNPDIGFIHSNLLLVDTSGSYLLMKPTFSNVGRGLPYLHPTMIVRKHLFEAIGLFNSSIKIAMDFDWIVRLEKRAIRGYYYAGDPVVKMEGGGKSIVEEKDAIKECFISLKENKVLSVKNLMGFSQRYLLFILRKMMTKAGLDSVLLELKKKKYS